MESERGIDISTWVSDRVQIFRMEHDIDFETVPANEEDAERHWLMLPLLCPSRIPHRALHASRKNGFRNPRVCWLLSVIDYDHPVSEKLAENYNGLQWVSR